MFIDIRLLKRALGKLMHVFIIVICKEFKRENIEKLLVKTSLTDI